jgi:hypothetical protein
MKKHSWVFWINISIRKQWFSYWWKTRGSNHIEFQVWIFKINIGQPWVDSVLKYHLENDGSLNYIDRINQDNLKTPFSFLINQNK